MPVLPPRVQNGKFAGALKRLWPHGNSRVPVSNSLFSATLF